MTIRARISVWMMAVAIAAASTASAEVVRVDVTSRTDLLGGKAFGDAGSFEKVVGTIYFEVDPSNPVNQIITDIHLAPRNERGNVEFRSDFYMLKPKEMSRANGTVFYEVSNRGRKGIVGRFNKAAGSLNPTTEAEMGDGFLMRQGFTLLWVGWQFDVPRQPDRVRLYAPVATQNGNLITGLVRSEVVVAKRATHALLADRGHVPYEIADPSHPENVMTVRDTVDGPRRVVPRDQWQFARVEDGKVVLDRAFVHLEGGFEPQKLYDVVYRAQRPTVVGLGPAAVRDTMVVAQTRQP